jgi:hypothetical protein
VNYWLGHKLTSPDFLALAKHYSSFFQHAIYSNYEYVLLTPELFRRSAVGAGRDEFGASWRNVTIQTFQNFSPFIHLKYPVSQSS